MKRRMLSVLIILNVLLMVSLTYRFMRSNDAVAQVHRPSDYILIPGEVSGGSTAVVYMVDTTNGWLGAMAYDDSRNALDTMPAIDLSRVFDTTGGGRPPANGTKPPAR